MVTSCMFPAALYMYSRSLVQMVDMLVTRLCWDSSTPFGIPVVPEEKGSRATSCSIDLYTGVYTGVYSGSRRRGVELHPAV